MSFLALELTVRIGRLAGAPWPSFHQLDPEIGWSLVPGREGWHLEEGDAWVKINCLGMRDRERSIAKPANGFRVAVLGDSYMEAVQVPYEESFTALLERKLGQQPSMQGRAVEVLNFGVHGYSTTQEYLTLRHRAWRFDPDVVIVGLYMGNDVMDNYPFRTDDPMLGKARPFFKLNGERMELDASYQKFVATPPPIVQWRRFLLEVKRRSRLAQFVASGAYKMFESANPDQMLAASPTFPAGVYKQPPEAAWQEAWLVTEGVLKMMRDEVQAKGKVFYLMLVTADYQVHPDAQLRQKYMKKVGVDRLDYPVVRLREFTQREHINLISLYEPFLEYAESHKTPLHGFKNTFGFIHWNQTGHQVASDVVAQRLNTDVAAGQR